jgi:hypothetical protein
MLDGEGMKTNLLAAFLFAFQLLTATGWADEIRQADYPAHYEVLNTDKGDKGAFQKNCSVTLRDQAKANVIITVSRKRIGSCAVLVSGQVYNGRQNEEKNAVELVIPVGENRARIESWHIDGTVKNPQ